MAVALQWLSCVSPRLLIGCFPHSRLGRMSGFVQTGQLGKALPPSCQVPCLDFPMTPVSEPSWSLPKQMRWQESLILPAVGDEAEQVRAPSARLRNRCVRGTWALTFFGCKSLGECKIQPRFFNIWKVGMVIALPTQNCCEDYVREEDWELA